MSDPVEWYDSLPDPLKEAPYFKPPEDGSHRTIEQVVSDLTNAANLQGNLAESHIKIPSPEASDEDKQAFTERVLGIDPSLTKKPDDFSPVPENAEAYPDIEVEGVELASLKELAAKYKWTEQQYRDYVAQAKSDLDAGVTAKNQWQVDQDNALAEKLGQAKADHLARTVAALKEGSPEVAELIQGNQLDARVVLALDTLVHQIIEMGGEGSEFNQQAGAGARVLTPDEARGKMNEIRTQLTNERLPWAEQQRLQEKLVEYQRLARPH